MRARRASGPQVLVVGGGMAGLCAALSARQAGARVTLLEAAPEHMRGGNLRHARNIRVPHSAPAPHLFGTYPAEEFFDDLCRISEGRGDPLLARLLAEEARDLVFWLAAQGVAFQDAHIPFSRKTAFFLGGGKAATNALYTRALRSDVDIRYETSMDTLDFAELPTAAVVLCCGGAQAGLVPKFINRGTPFDRGGLMKSLISQGAAVCGDECALHLVAVDARSPEHDGGIATRTDGMQHGMVVDAHGRRFADETAICGSRRYGLWGQAIAALPEGRAFLVVDAVGVKKLPTSIFLPIRAQSLCDLAQLTGADRQTLLASADESGRVSVPPFFAWPVRAGVTFTCHGLRVDATARVVMADGGVCANLFAAGAILAPAILHAGYLSGTALTISAVFGRLAGREAARHVLG